MNEIWYADGRWNALRKTNKSPLKWETFAFLFEKTGLFSRAICYFQGGYSLSILGGGISPSQLNNMSMSNWMIFPGVENTNCLKPPPRICYDFGFPYLAPPPRLPVTTRTTLHARHDGAITPKKHTSFVPFISKVFLSGRGCRYNLESKAS